MITISKGNAEKTLSYFSNDDSKSSEKGKYHIQKEEGEHKTAINEFGLSETVIKEQILPEILGNDLEGNMLTGSK